MPTWLDVVLVVVFALVGGVFSAAEMALVSLRESQVAALRERSRRGERLARLVADPNRFLAASQVGVTLAGFFSAAVGAATLAQPVARGLRRLGLAAGAADPLGFVLVTVVVSFVALVLGELAPKRLALQRTEGYALLVAGPLDVIARVSRPVIVALSGATDLVVRLAGGDPAAGRATITEDELRGLVAAHESLTTYERRLIDDVFGASERTLSEVMVPRTEVAFLDAAMPLADAVAQVGVSPHSRYPVVGPGGPDDVVGFVHIRDLALAARPAAPTSGRPGGDSVRSVLRPVRMLPGSANVLTTLSEMRRGGEHVVIVVDEYGGTDGLVSLEDLIEEVIGDIRDEYDLAPGVPAAARPDGLVEVEGRTNLDDLADLTGLRLPEGPYETVAGYVMAALGRIPAPGDRVTVHGRSLRVTAVDGRRVARVAVGPVPARLQESGA